jgi:hypothetical protein
VPILVNSVSSVAVVIITVPQKLYGLSQLAVPIANGDLSVKNSQLYCAPWEIQSLSWGASWFAIWLVVLKESIMQGIGVLPRLTCVCWSDAIFSSAMVTSGAFPQEKFPVSHKEAPWQLVVSTKLHNMKLYSLVSFGNEGLEHLANLNQFTQVFQSAQEKH